MTARILLISGLVFVLSACQTPEEKVADHLKSAQEYYGDREYSLANVELKNALQIDPNTAEAYYLRALILIGEQEWRAAYDHLQRTVELQPEHVRAQSEIAKLYLMSGELEDARLTADKVMSLAPEALSSLVLMGTYYVRDGDIENAAHYADLVKQQDATDLEGIALDFSVRIAQSDLQQAEAAFARALENHPEEPATYLYQIRLAQARNENQGVVDGYRNLLKLDTENLGYWQALAAFYIQQDDSDGAERILREAVAAMPEQNEPKLLLARFLSSDSPELAIESLQSFIDTAPNTTLRFALADIYRSQGRLDDAAGMYESVLNSDAKQDDVFDAQAQLAAIALRSDRSEEARNLIDSVLAVESDHPDALLLQAYMDLSEQRVDSAIANVRVVLRDEPTNDKALTVLGEAYLLQQSLDLAESSFAQALELNPYNALAAKRLAALYVQRDEFKLAESALKPVVNTQRADLETAHMLVRINLATSDWNEAQRIADLVGGANSEYAEFIKAVSLQEQGDYQGAVEVYQRLLESNPGNSAVVRGFLSALSEVDPNAPETYLQERLLVDNGDLIAVYYLADNLVARDRTAEAQTLIEDSLDVKPEWIRGYILLADLHLSRSEKREAMEAYKTGLTQNPGKVVLKLGYASISEQLGYADEAEATYRNILQEVPKFDEVANNLAILVSRREERLAEALAIASRFETTSNPVFADTLGWLLVREGNYQEASSYLELAATASPENSEIQYHLGVLRYFQQRTDEALSALKSSKRISVETGTRLAQEDESRRTELLAKLDSV